MERTARITRFGLACIAAFATLSSATASITDAEHEGFGPSEAAARQNAFDIFNTIHSAMRQWGSSLNHNGMSLFLTTIPAGVTLHHGTHSPTPPPGPEWLAFEIEHAEQFAHPRWRRRDNPGSPGSPPPGSSPPPSMAQQPLHFPRQPSYYHQPSLHLAKDADADSYGYLHTYLTTTLLQLLYLDGTSAGNTDMGTLDTQDLILRLNRSAPLWDERGRAQELCDIVSSWGLDGVLRMEAGFEVIKCDFSKGLELVSANRRPDCPAGGCGSGGGGVEGEVRLFEYIRAVSRRYHDIGGGRVKIDWGSMVSGFFYEIDLANPNGTERMPRLVGPSDDELRAIRLRVEDVVKGRRGEVKMAVDWQGVVDMVVARYADRLKYMAEVDTVEVMQAEVNGLLNTHIDHAVEDDGHSAAMGRCSRFYTLGVAPQTHEDGLVLAAVETVTHSICSTLFQVRKMVVEEPDAAEGSLERARRELRNLMDKLRWARWKECAGCGFDEVCFIPVWPYGDKEAHERPSCRNTTSLMKGWWDRRYWQPGPPMGSK
ncbi:hypothetical protein N657DRAFT_647592 [Parathielavia appendiculata]|uniref:Uncharacterized protein n=1 Tax=Parathielavia appendiculata TaxID=2587402 RepID=A0AAN6TXS6_9PEZI|nr:hypothetical protein N657DRAFT_647592 [Parathielavia appendiculata]